MRVILDHVEVTRQGRRDYPTEYRLSFKPTSHPAITAYRSTWSKQCHRKQMRRWTQNSYDATKV